MSQKKILHLRSSGGLLGAERVIIELCKFSPHFGYIPIIGALKDAEDPLPDFLNFFPHHTEQVIFSTKGTLELSLFRQIKSYIRDNRIDLIHCHGYKEDFYTLALGKDVAKLATNHLWKKTNLKGNIYALIDSLVLHTFDCSVAVSSEIAEEMTRKRIPNIRKINNGVDIHQFSPRPRSARLQSLYRLTAEDLVLGMISSLTPEKGHSLVIQALASLTKSVSGLKLVIVGDGPCREDIVQESQKYGIEKHVIFAGRQHDIPAHLSIFDVFLIPSLREGLPMAMLEAMAAGKCVVASRVGEIPNVINHRSNGLLINPGKTEDIKQAIYALASDSLLLRQCQKMAVETIKSSYTSILMTQQYCNLYTELLSRAGSSKSWNGSPGARTACGQTNFKD